MLGESAKIHAMSFTMKTVFLSALLVAFSLQSAEPANETSQPPAADAKADKEISQAKNIFPLAEDVSGTKLIQKRDEYLKARKWVLGYSRSNPNSAYLGWAEGTIQAKSDDVKFGQSRVLAFETASMEAKGDFVRSQQRVTTTETLRKVFHESWEISEEDAANEIIRVKVIWEKILALTDAKLDKALEDAGIDSAQFRTQPIEHRRKLLEDSISRTIKIRALESVAGVRVMATFEDLNAVGVLVVYSDNQRELTKNILIGRTVATPNASSQKEQILKQIEAACPSGEKELAHAFGVRVMTDENGDRVLVSFGQWSPAVTQADSRFRRDTAIKTARAQAMNLADGALTDFVNSTLALESDSSVWQSAELNRIISPKSIEEVESLAIGETLRTIIKQHGKATLQGVTTIKEWTVNHPETGHLLVGHILMWSPSSRDAAIHGLNRHLTAKQGTGNSRTNENKIRISPDFDKDADF